MTTGTVASSAPEGRHRSAEAESAVRRLWRHPRFPDLAVVTAYVLGGLYVTVKLWVHPDRMVNYWPDEILFEWHVAHAAQALIHLDNPLFTTSLNTPDGVNLMGNTSVLGLGIPLAPVTLLFGAHTTFLVGLWLSFTGTATGWYLVLSRQLRTSRTAAAVGGVFCGFAPGMLSQSTGNLHMTAQFLVPAIVWAVFRAVPGAGHPPHRRGRTVRGGIVLGLLITWQVFLGEEVLLLTAVALAMLTALLAGADLPAAGARLRSFAGGLGVAFLTSGVLLAYPLWFQFFGPGHYRGLPVDPTDHALDLKSYTLYSRHSLAGWTDVNGLAPNLTEQNSFLGLPLVVLCVAIVMWLWRLAVVRAIAVTVLIFTLLSLGDEIIVAGHSTGVPGPNRLLRAMPLFDAVVPARYALVIVPMLGVLLALAVDRPLPAESARPRLRWLGLGLIAAALLPVAPLPLTTYAAPPVPPFILSGEWRPYVPEGRTIVPVPPTGNQLLALSGMAWSAPTDLAFPIPGGYFIGPSAPDDPAGRWSSGPERPTATLLARVAADGVVPAVTDQDRASLVEDLRYWRAAIVVLSDDFFVPEALRLTLEALLGPGQHLSGAWVWDVRELVGP